MELKSVGVLSCGKLFGAMYAALGVLIGALVAVASMAGAGQAQGANADNAAFMMGMGVGAVLFVPILYGILGFIGGIVSAFLYNLFAGMIGGIELNFQQQPEYYE